MWLHSYKTSDYKSAAYKMTQDPTVLTDTPDQATDNALVDPHPNIDKLEDKRLIACLDCPVYVQAVLDASLWAAAKLDLPINLLHVTHEKSYYKTHDTTLDYSNFFDLCDQKSNQTSTNLDTKIDQKANLSTDFVHSKGDLLYQTGEKLLQYAEKYSRDHHKKYLAHSITRLHSLETWSESVNKLDEFAELMIIGHHLTCDMTLAQMIRPRHCPILVTPATFVKPQSALFAFDNRPACHRLLAWLCQSPLVRNLQIHVVMVAKPTQENQDALREAYARLKQAGIDSKKALLDCRDVTASLLYYQQQHNLQMLMTGAFGQSRLKSLLKGSATEKFLDTAKTPYLLFPKD